MTTRADLAAFNSGTARARYAYAVQPHTPKTIPCSDRCGRTTTHDTGICHVCRRKDTP